MKKRSAIKKMMLVLILVISAYYIGKTSTPSKVKIITKEKIVKEYLNIKSENIDLKKNIKIVTRIIYKTDGTRIEEKTQVDKSISKSLTVEDIQEKSAQTTQTKKQLKYNDKKVTISVFSIAQIIPPKLTPEIGVLVQYPSFLFLNTGIGATNQGKLLISIGISF